MCYKELHCICSPNKHTLKKSKSEYNQEIPQSHTCRPTHSTVMKSHRAQVTRHQEDNWSKATSSLFLVKKIAKLERTLSNVNLNRNDTVKSQVFPMSLKKEKWLTGPYNYVSAPWRVKIHMSRDMRFPKMLYVRPAKAQTSLHIRAVWSEPFLGTWII